MPFGKYEIIFESIYQKQEIIEFELNNKVQKETLCIDQIGYKLSNSNLLSNQLKEDDKLTIDYNSSGCFHYTEYQLEIMRKGGLYVAKLPDTVFRLSPSQLQLIKEFEFELRNIKSNQCSTSDTYSLTTARNSETIEFTDASCHWNGYKGLLKKLGYKK